MILSACPGEESLHDYVLGLMNHEQAAHLDEHLSHCSRCVSLLEQVEDEDDLVAVVRVQARTPRPRNAKIDSLRAQLRGLQPLVAAPSTVANADTNSGTMIPVQTNETDEVALLLAPPQTADEIGRLGSYRIVKLLGAGGMGLVFLAEDLTLKRRVALKVMRPKLVRDGEARTRFLREAQAMAAVSHDHIVAVHQVGEERGVPFFAMPLLEGEMLEERLQRERCLPLSEVIRIGRETALGLAAAHERGLVHRDIKPANLWLEGPNSRVKILDFGLTLPQEAAGQLTNPGRILGTPAYMAPEQMEGDAEPRSDLFSLGCVLYRMSTGEVPFPGKTVTEIMRNTLLHEPLPPRQLNPAVSPRLSGVIMRLLAKDRVQRPASARAVVEELDALGNSASLQAASPGRQPRPLKRPNA